MKKLNKHPPNVPIPGVSVRFQSERLMSSWPEIRDSRPPHHRNPHLPTWFKETRRGSCRLWELACCNLEQLHPSQSSDETLTGFTFPDQKKKQAVCDSAASSLRAWAQLSGPVRDASTFLNLTSSLESRPSASFTAAARGQDNLIQARKPDLFYSVRKQTYFLSMLKLQK